MVVHKMDCKHPASYSNLLLAAGKLERWAEPRDALLPKTTTTGGSNYYLVTDIGEFVSL